MRNKKTGTTIEFDAVLLVKNGKNGVEPAHLEYPSLEAVIEEWEDVPKPKDMPKEPEEHWYLTSSGDVTLGDASTSQLELRKKIGNDFRTVEDTALALAKLRAWERLKDKGFRFVEWQQHGITEDGVMDGAVYFDDAKNVNRSDLDLLFSGEDD